jgi:murein tripeptide amidase MpaA
MVFSVLCAGIHAREWISTATVTYILNKLLTSQDPVIQDLKQSFDYYVLPSVNPDGYVYSHTTVRSLFNCTVTKGTTRNIQTFVCGTRNHWVHGLCPSSGILNN